jgi:hypothetical protein
MRELDWRRTEMRVVRDEWRAALADTRQAWEAAYEGWECPAMVLMDLADFEGESIRPSPPEAPRLRAAWHRSAQLAFPSRRTGPSLPSVPICGFTHRPRPACSGTLRKEERPGVPDLSRSLLGCWVPTRLAPGLSAFPSVPPG